MTTIGAGLMVNSFGLASGLLKVYSNFLTGLPANKL